MLEFESLRFKNFMSYGSQWTELPLGGLGQCLILGEIVDQVEEGEIELSDDENRTERSNGAGKSGLTNAMLWCLFGRTMHSAAPGTKVVNWFTKEDCVVEAKFKNGDMITRVLTAEGKTELFFVRGGQEQKLLSEVRATTKLHQTMLNKEFGLDWEIFCGSVFFSQYGKPWLEMPDQARKQALERMLRVDRFNLYAQVAKERQDKLDGERVIKRKRCDDITKAIASQREQCSEFQEQLAGFEAGRVARQEREAKEAATAAAKRDAVELPDLEKLRQKWGIVDQVKQKIQTMATEAEKLSRQADGARRDAEAERREAIRCETRVKAWKSKAGKQCIECEQPIECTHTDQKIEPLVAEHQRILAVAAEHAGRATELDQQCATMQAKRRQAEQKLVDMQPKLTMSQAEDLHRTWNYYDRQIKDAHARSVQIGLEQNPHGTGIERAEKRIVALDQEQAKIGKEVSDIDALYTHIAYINSCYRDRKKMKSHALSKYMPQLNSRLSHYLDTFNLDLQLEFTNSLGINSDKWGYDFFCGGERKRADIALMLSIFDLHERMYGRQCNVVVLDEVDSRLDTAGVESLVQIIKNDIASRVETVLIVSHRSTMMDLFPRQIMVRREGRLSYLDEIR